ncbi:MAG: prenyltransferase [Desulfarculaceae bacterium]|nr:prenyltransferase [Desulfarculaceae bacterium]MCF8071281.1 prenyltransferase [Desulfarculaceae bacterium]MCF8101116.1 prenyltransferase [Desulfarculaceae bacterium]MCF8115335.1 prenyltransferase [Desulfarculaceae bacterium]
MPPPLLVRAARLPFLTGSLLPVLVTAAWWWGQGPLPWGLLLLTLAGAGFLQTGANLINDFHDAQGSDPLNRFATQFSGGSRVIQDGLMSRGRVGLLAMTFFAAAGVCGGLLAGLGRPWSLALGAAGLAGGWIYSAGPLALMSIGLGELAIMILFGPLLTWSTGYVLGGDFFAKAWWLGLPQAWLITAVLWINQFPDLAADAAAGKNNLVVRLGLPRSRVVYAGLMLAPFPTLVWLVQSWGLTPWLYLAWGGLIPAAKAVGIAWKHYADPPAVLPAQALTIIAHLSTGLLMVLGLLLGKWLG